MEGNKPTAQDAIDKGVTGEELAVLVGAGHVEVGEVATDLQFHSPTSTTPEGVNIADIEQSAIEGVRANGGARAIATSMTGEQVALAATRFTGIAMLAQAIKDHKPTDTK